MESPRESYAPLMAEKDLDQERSASESTDTTERQAFNEVCRWCRGENTIEKRGRWYHRRININIILCHILLFGAFMFGVATTLAITAWRGQQAQIYNNDFHPAQQSVELEKIRFTGSALFDDEGEPFFDYDEDEKLYTGKPSAAMDRNWSKLIQQRYFLISDEEALEAWGPGYEQYYKWPGNEKSEGGYVAGLDVLHTLHCVNMLRKALSPDHYHMKSSESFQQYHIDHCLNIVRQSVQCSSDLTLIPTRWWDGLGKHGRNFIDSDQVHTCRNFGKVREWATKRWNGWHRIGNAHARPKGANMSHTEEIMEHEDDDGDH